MEEDEAITNFLAVVGTDDVAVARQYLEMAGFDVPGAVGLYYETFDVLEREDSRPQPSGPAAASSRPAVDEIDQSFCEEEKWFSALFFPPQSLMTNAPFDKVQPFVTWIDEKGNPGPI